mgnify:CR=1 FL=1
MPNDLPVKILHILDHSLPLHSGYSFRTKNIFRSQKKRGWEPIGLTSPKHELSIYGSGSLYEEIDGLRFFRTPMKSLGNNWLLSHFRIIIELTQRILKVAKDERPQILHAHSPVLNAVSAMWAGKKLGIPVVYEIRAFWEDAAVDHGTYKQRSWKYFLVRKVEWWVCRRIKQIAVLCNGVKDDLVERGIDSGKMAVIPNGVSLDDFDIGKTDEILRRSWDLNGKKVIAFIGSFYRYEGLELLVAAFSSLLESRKDLVLLLVGGGEMEGEIRSQVKKLGIENYVVMPGRVAHSKISEVYGLADFLVYARFSMRLTELVTPLKPLEAMIVGKPLLASDIRGHRELIQDGETGIFFKPGNLKSLVEGMERLLEDEGLRNRMSSQGRAWVRKERSWDATTCGYQEIYDKALRVKR